MNLSKFIHLALQEDVGPGDYSTLASISENANGKAKILIKEAGILSGINVAADIFKTLEPSAEIILHFKDGDAISIGDIVMEIRAKVHTILKAERLVLNCMQRMCGIATLTHQFAEKIKGYKTKVLDTRKTTPLFRQFEKEAVLSGGGMNHRMGLYDMIMLKDNHIDYCGGITKAILTTNAYLKEHNLNIPIEIETRSLNEVKEVLTVGKVQRIMLDNFNPQLVAEGVALINNRFETEASGGIQLENIEEYAKAGVDFISIGALTHHAVSLDISLKAVVE